jgi:hypothetical protein
VILAILFRPITTAARSFLFVVFVASAAGCGTQGVLTEQVEARRLASELHVLFTKAAEASNRAVMADTDEASVAAAREAQDSTKSAVDAAQKLQPILQSLGYREEIASLQAFNTRFAEYQTLDREILPLAVENTNLKAQRLSFGAARDAANAFRDALESAARPAPAKSTCCADALVARATAAMLEAQVIEARHIAESSDEAMTRMEAEMASAEMNAQTSLDALRGMLPPSARPHLDAAAAALDRFTKINREIVTLSRRNSNVRSLALSLGRKRTITAECDDRLQALQDALSRHELKATR